MPVLPYKLSFSFTSATGSYGSDNAGGFFGQNAYYVGLNAAGGTTAFTDATIIFNATGNCLSLNNAPAIPLSSIPAGFNIVSATGFQNSAAGIPGHIMQRSGSAPGTSFARMITQWGTAGGPHTDQVNGGTGVQDQVAPNFVPIPQTPADLAAALSIEITINDSARMTSLIFQSLQFLGTYQIITYQFQINNLTHPQLPANTAYPGDVLQITPVPPTPPVMNAITQVTIGSAVINPPFCTQSAYAIQTWAPCADGTNPVLCPNAVGTVETICTIVKWANWCCPTNPPKGTVPVSIVAPTLFSGSVSLGTLTILPLNATGMYTITPGLTHDTLYANPGVDNSTQVVSIKGPGWKVGPIGG